MGQINGVIYILAGESFFCDGMHWEEVAMQWIGITDWLYVAMALVRCL